MSFLDPQFDSYRLVLLCASTRRVLLESAGTQLNLPRISIPRWTRAAKEITDLIRHKWQFEGIVLDFLGDRPGAGGIVLVERIDQDTTRRSPDGHRCGLFDDVHDVGITDEERSIVDRLLADGTTGRGAFSKVGWIEDVVTWIKEVATEEGFQSSGRVEQFNASADSALIRYSGQDGRACWFKAAGGPNASEGRITATLASLFPEYLPEIIGSHQAWNAWLMKDGGTPLSAYNLGSSEILQVVVRRLAELQTRSGRHIGRLLDDGCRDHRMKALRAAIPEITPHLEEAVRSKDARTGHRVGVSRLRRVARLIEEATLRLEELGIPDALQHGDIDPRNILIGSRGPVFTDWAQASIGNPFVTFEQLRAQLSQSEATRTILPRLARIYQEVWKPSLPSCRFDYAFKLMPLIALASYLCSRRDWLTAKGLSRSQSQSYARILARQLDRAAYELEQDTEISA